MEAKSYGMQFLFFEKLISHWSRLRFLLAVHPCDHAVDSFPKWYDTWKSAQKWGRESHFFNLVTFLTNTKKFKNPWLGAPGPFFGLFQWCQGMFLKVPEGFQRKKISSCAETKLVPYTSSRVFNLDLAKLYFKDNFLTTLFHLIFHASNLVICWVILIVYVYRSLLSNLICINFN